MEKTKPDVVSDIPLREASLGKKGAMMDMQRKEVKETMARQMRMRFWYGDRRRCLFVKAMFVVDMESVRCSVVGGWRGQYSFRVLPGMSLSSEHVLRIG